MSVLAHNPQGWVAASGRTGPELARYRRRGVKGVRAWSDSPSRVVRVQWFPDIFSSRTNLPAYLSLSRGTHTPAQFSLYGCKSLHPRASRFGRRPKRLSAQSRFRFLLKRFTCGRLLPHLPLSEGGFRTRASECADSGGGSGFSGQQNTQRLDIRHRVHGVYRMYRLSL